MIVPECLAFVLENLPVTVDNTLDIKQRCLVKQWRLEMLTVEEQCMQ